MTAHYLPSHPGFRGSEDFHAYQRECLARAEEIFATQRDMRRIEKALALFAKRAALNGRMRSDESYADFAAYLSDVFRDACGDHLDMREL